jgi:hypothetical protein
MLFHPVYREQRKESKYLWFWSEIKELKKFSLSLCSAQTVTRIGLLEEIPRSGVRRTRTLCYHAQTPVWSESSVDEHNLYFTRSAIIGYLAVETWRVKTELIIITILHMIIITTSILNLDFKTFAPKILARTTCMNRYWKYTQIFAAKIKAKLIAKNRQNLLQK